MLVLLFLAISNNIGIANLDFKIPLPESITSLLSPVRASGRLVWPIMYLLLTYSLYITFKFVETKSAKVILCSLLVLQILDTSLGWKNLNLDSKNINNNLVLTDPRWNELAAQGIENIVVLPTSNECNRFVELGFIANQYGMATNCVYLARISTRDVDASRRRILNELLMDDLRSNTVYILSDAELALVSKLGAKNLQPENLNGFNVIRRKFVK
jgi:hypothetical protein